jgi:hypothetical protein
VIRLKPTLYFFKSPPRYGAGRGALLTKYSILCAVIDLEDNRDYPHNFIANLPLYWKHAKKRWPKFSKVFGVDTFKIAENLLQEALKRETDLEIKENIMFRISLLPSNDV